MLDTWQLKTEWPRLKELKNIPVKPHFVNKGDSSLKRSPATVSAAVWPSHVTTSMLCDRDIRAVISSFPRHLRQNTFQDSDHRGGAGRFVKPLC